MEDKEDKWDDYIEGTLFTLNTNKSATTKYSPFFLMFGRNPRLPFEVEKTEQSSFTTSGDVAQVMDDLGSEEAITAHVNEMSQMRDSLFPQVNENIKIAQAKQQQQYQKKRAKQNGCPFKVGDLVLQRNMLQKTKAGYKYQDQWLGPYQITEINAEKGTCRLAKKSGKKLRSKCLSAISSRIDFHANTNQGTPTVNPRRHRPSRELILHLRLLLCPNRGQNLEQEHLPCLNRGTKVPLIV